MSSTATGLPHGRWLLDSSYLLRSISQTQRSCCSTADGTNAGIRQRPQVVITRTTDIGVPQRSHRACTGMFFGRVILPLRMFECFSQYAALARKATGSLLQLVFAQRKALNLYSSVTHEPVEDTEVCC
jgi:hypothetical protein